MNKTAVRYRCRTCDDRFTLIVDHASPQLVVGLPHRRSCSNGHRMEIQSMLPVDPIQHRDFHIDHVLGLGFLAIVIAIALAWIMG